jgi:hypothetical protein
MSSTMTTPEFQTLPDQEKQEPASPDLDSESLVKWDEGHDDLNPQNFHTTYKWLLVTVVSVGSLLVCVKNRT